MDSLRKSVHGFTLIEVAIVVAIMTILLTLGLSLMNAQLSSTAYTATKKRQEAVKDALIAYLGANRRLPCPYVPVAGTEVNGQASAQSGIPLACPAFGIVPFDTLGLSRDFGEDGWGNFFSYRVYTDSPPNCPTGWDWGNENCFGEGKDGINPARSAQKISNGTVGTSTTITDKSIAVVISHGANGLGAWAAQGTRNVAPTTCEEAHNAVGATPLPAGCTPVSNIFYKGERDGNDDVVAYLTAAEVTQTLVKQGTIKSATAKANDDLQTLADTAIAQKRSNFTNVSVLGIITISTTDCQATVDTGDMRAALDSMLDPWGLRYEFAQHTSGFPICLFSTAGTTNSCTASSTTCSSASPVICKTLDKATFNAYLARAGAAGCP